MTSSLFRPRFRQPVGFEFVRAESRNDRRHDRGDNHRQQRTPLRGRFLDRDVEFRQTSTTATVGFRNVDTQKSSSAEFPPEFRGLPVIRDGLLVITATELADQPADVLAQLPMVIREIYQ